MEKISGLNTVPFRKATVSSTLMIRLGFQGYRCCKSRALTSLHGGSLENTFTVPSTLKGCGSKVEHILGVGHAHTRYTQTAHKPLWDRLYRPIVVPVLHATFLFLLPSNGHLHMIPIQELSITIFNLL